MPSSKQVFTKDRNFQFKILRSRPTSPLFYSIFSLLNPTKNASLLAHIFFSMMFSFCCDQKTDHEKASACSHLACDNSFKMDSNERFTIAVLQNMIFSLSTHNLSDSLFQWVFFPFHFSAKSSLHFPPKKAKCKSTWSKTTHQMSTFSLQGSFLMTSGAIQDTVPANDILVLFSFHSRLVPKSEIFTTSFLATRTLEVVFQCHTLSRNSQNCTTHSPISAGNLQCM